ncbi:two-component sensor histidine kinase [Actinomadura barringtoniae]|uniref:histidine kinase n=1 Tax=Actinomadura barringtoniae TaxID=1427535 RepID=A0A939TCM4_9ACTN|nr:sensor histidine kinase [Actinomadura barringtoniae]MBO2454717.1 two-component sensor histidine kinase [Actinomadura barringtoniae]
MNERGRPQGHGQPTTRRGLIRDAILWVLLATPVVIGNLAPPEPRRPLWWLTLAGTLALGAAIAAGRRHPLVPLLVVTFLLPLQGNFAFALPVAAYLAGRRTPRAQPVVWIFTVTFAGGTLLNIARGIDVTSWFPLTLWFVLLAVLPWLAGRYWRQYQELVHAGWERAEQLEREHRIVAERERLRERARIAQDMHDSLGHELALIAVRAGALQVAPDLPERHRAAAADLRAGAADATDQLRGIIGVLREDHLTSGGGADRGEAAVRPARESITDLVDRARGSGIDVTLTATDTGEDAEAGAESREQAPMVALAAHRLVQEALTNAAKHAPGAPVTVTLARPHGRTVVTVTNTAPPGGPRPPGPSGGLGLTGLTERVRLAGGTLTTGPTPAGGFQVTADLPDDPAPPAGTGLEGTGPPTARRLASERRQVRRGLITAITVPAALVAFLSAIMLGYYAYSTLNSVLAPADYNALRTGQPRADIERVLPRNELLNSADIAAQFPAPPPGSACRFYRSDGNLLGVGTVYRLCFTAGRLAAKDAVRPNAAADHRTP